MPLSNINPPLASHCIKHCSDPLLRSYGAHPGPAHLPTVPLCSLQHSRLSLSPSPALQGPRTCLNVTSSLVRGTFPNHTSNIVCYSILKMSQILLCIYIFDCLLKKKSLPRDSHPYPRTESFLRGSSYFLCSLLYLAHSIYSLPSYSKPPSLMTYGEVRVPFTLIINYGSYKISFRF